MDAVDMIDAAVPDFIFSMAGDETVISGDPDLINDLHWWDGTTETGSPLAGGPLLPDAKIDAVDRIGPSMFVFSTDIDVTLDGTDYQKEDLILWDGGADLGSQFSLFFDGTPYFNADIDVNVNAVVVVDPEIPILIISLDGVPTSEGVEVPGVLNVEGTALEPVFNSDLILWDGDAFVMFFDSSVVGTGLDGPRVSR